MRTLALLALVAMLAGCGSKTVAGPTGSAGSVSAGLAGEIATTTTTAATTTVKPGASTMTEADPYDLYLALVKEWKLTPTLSRDDAQARALLGCFQPNPAPKTTDAALAWAYAAQVTVMKAKGMCG